MIRYDTLWGTMFTNFQPKNVYVTWYNNNDEQTGYGNINIDGGYNGRDDNGKIGNRI